MFVMDCPYEMWQLLLRSQGWINISHDTSEKVLFQYSFSRDNFQMLVLDVGKSCIMASPVCAIKQTSGMARWSSGQDTTLSRW